MTTVKTAPHAAAATTNQAISVMTASPAAKLGNPVAKNSTAWPGSGGRSTTHAATTIAETKTNTGTTLLAMPR
jgi:hypothetical protein